MTTIITARQEQILGYILPGIGVILTSTRLTIRNRYGHLGLDDLAVLVSSIAQISLMISTNLYTAESIKFASGKSSIFYWTAVSYYIIIWASRLSILLSIGRIAPTYRTVRFCRITALGYIAIWAGLNAQLFIVCQREQGWKKLDPPQCPLGRVIAFTMLATDILGDSVIIIVPARSFWQTSLPVHKRVRLTAVFAISIITTLIGFAHIYFILHGPPLVENLMGILQSSISVIVCNLPVNLASLIRLTRPQPDPNKPPEVTKESSVEFAGLSTLEGRTHESHISGLTGLTGLTHVSSKSSFGAPGNGISEIETKGESSSEVGTSTQGPGTSSEGLEAGKADLESQTASTPRNPG